MKISVINQKFLKNLKKTFGRKVFTTKQAEKLYEKDHWISCNDRYEYLGDPNKVPDHDCFPTTYPGSEGKEPCKLHWRKRTNAEIRAWHKARGQRIDNWGEMNARNTIATAAQHGLLRRIRRGVYTFRKGS